MVRCLVVALAVALSCTLAGCATANSPELRVLGVQKEPRHEVVFVQVTNPASRPIQLTKLEYRFAAGSATVSEGKLELFRDVPAGEAVVLEVPVDAAPREPLTLRGKLTAVTDEIVRIFNVSAEVQPTAAGAK
jgi:hypothetical protein